MTDENTCTGTCFCHAVELIMPKLSFRPSVHVNYQETVLPVKDSLPKQRDIPVEMDGSGLLLPE